MNPEVPVRVTVAEGKHRKVSTGVGYGTEEHGRARIRWDHVNFFGGAQTGRRRRQVVVARSWRPARLPRTVFPAAGRLAQLRRPGLAGVRAGLLDSNQLGGRDRRSATSRRQQTFWTMSLINEYQRSGIDAGGARGFHHPRRSDRARPRPARRRVAGHAVGGGVRHRAQHHDATCSTPASGYVVNAHVEQAGKWLCGTYNYWSATAEAPPLPADRDAGSSSPTGCASARLPPTGDDRGQRAVLQALLPRRGVEHPRLGPLRGQSAQRLRLARSAASRCWRDRPRSASRSGASSAPSAFVDYGNVWAESWDLRRRATCAYAVGPGLRYQTPIGPARIDVGYQLNPIDGLLVNGEPQKRPLAPALQHRPGILMANLMSLVAALAPGRRASSARWSSASPRWRSSSRRPPGSRSGCAASSSGRPTTT